MQTFPLLIEPEDLKQYFEQGLISPQHIRIVDLSRESIYQQIHLPHAIHLSPKQLLRQFEDATGLLPTDDALNHLMHLLHLSDQHWVIAYDDEGGAWASRLMWTLHCVGFNRVSVLNGGIHTCIAYQLPLVNEEVKLISEESIYQINQQQINKYRIEYQELLDNIKQCQPSFQLWDCRSLEEFSGEKRMARRAGHIPYAVHFDWVNLFDKNQYFKLNSLEYIKMQLTQCGLNLAQPLVVYCQSHHRSSLAYLVARLLQCSVRAYDGAWSEWGNRSDSLIISGK